MGVDTSTATRTRRRWGSGTNSRSSVALGMVAKSSSKSSSSNKNKKKNKKQPPSPSSSSAVSDDVQRSVVPTNVAKNDDDDDSTSRRTMDRLDDDNDNTTTNAPPPPLELPGQEAYYDPDDVDIDIDELTVLQLRQQLRLRGQPVSGNKAVLQQRLWQVLVPYDRRFQEAVTAEAEEAGRGTSATTRTTTPKGKKRNDGKATATSQPPDFDDVSAYLDEEDRGKAFKTMNIQDAEVLTDDDDDDNDDERKMAAASTTEVWGSEARLMVNDNNKTGMMMDRRERPVVDALSQTVLEYRGSNQTYVTATIIASRDALKPMLQGGSSSNVSSTTSDAAVDIAVATEQRLYEIQSARERQLGGNPRPKINDDDDLGPYGSDEGSSMDHMMNVNVDWTDWGKFTTTGAQLSAQEVAGIILLPDRHSNDQDDIIALAEKIAFECQPVIVMIPDIYQNAGMFLDEPQQPQDDDDKMVDYDVEWRPPTVAAATAQKRATAAKFAASREELRLSVNIRAAAACLRDTYRVSSVVLWGLGVGGGRALVEAAGHVSSIHDVDGTSIAPPPVRPAAVIVWYPTYYYTGKNENDKKPKVTTQMLFGKERRQLQQQSGRRRRSNNSSSKMAIMGVFGEKDPLPGATKDDAVLIKALLEDDERIVDHMIKVFPGQDHGFAHIGLAQKVFAASAMDPTTRFVEEEFGGAGQLGLDGDDSESDVACLLSTSFMEAYSRVFLPTVGTPIAKNEDEAEWGRTVEMKDLSTVHRRDVRAEIEDALRRNTAAEPDLESGPLLDPDDPEDFEEFKQYLRAMEKPNTPEDLKIQDDDDLESIYAKLTAADENFQLW
jgi:dienelactone hydrolase